MPSPRNRAKKYPGSRVMDFQGSVLFGERGEDRVDIGPGQGKVIDLCPECGAPRNDKEDGPTLCWDKFLLDIS